MMKQTPLLEMGVTKAVVSPFSLPLLYWVVSVFFFNLVSDF